MYWRQDAASSGCAMPSDKQPCVRVADGERVVVIAGRRSIGFEVASDRRLGLPAAGGALWLRFESSTKARRGGAFDAVPNECCRLAARGAVARRRTSGAEVHRHGHRGVPSTRGC